MKEFTRADIARMREAEKEKQDLSAFLSDQFVKYAVFTRYGAAERIVSRVKTAPLRVINPLSTVTVNDDEGNPIEAFAVEESLGGDRFGSDYAIHYLPADFAFEHEKWKDRYASFVMSGKLFPSIRPNSRHTS